MKTLVYILVVSLFFSAPLTSYSNYAFATTKTDYQSAIDKLTSMQLRPTVADVKKALKPWPTKNPFGNSDSRQIVAISKDLDSIAKMIAAIELHFPGAVIAPMGRDAVLFGDMMDAFYTAIGQPNRVARINGSGLSLRIHDQQLLVDFLKTTGYDISKADQLPPFLFFDRTGFASNSQMRYLLNAAYTQYTKSGKDPVKLLKKLNGMNSGGVNQINFRNRKARGNR
jgi:hypothetical protein